MYGSTSSADGDVAALETLSKDNLKDKWTTLYGTVPPKRMGRDLLMRGVAHRIQEQAQGGPCRALKRRLSALVKELHQTGDVTIADRPPVKPGTRLIRDWQGETHEVTVREDGFIWRGARYRSLSQIARAITGTRWSGPAFFGLKQSRRRNAACGAPDA